MGCGEGPARQDVETGRPLRSRIAQRLNVQGEYASPLRPLRPCGTTSLNILVAQERGGGYRLDFEVDLPATVYEGSPSELQWQDIAFLLVK